ncbi:DUF4175 domain-containing protein [Microbulbifer litoralis]|uniref:DUF4175 domain-containing protein n=1 Tax=Microbulbifer litoralis TaxID=2933965 RepID=UPI0020297F34|nr:DUF4175 domain-containing protein [Microbulbifer sp. GX H0434]
MTQPSGKLLARAARHWRNRALLPYAALTLLAAGIAWQGHRFWQWPAWSLAAVVAPVVLALLLDRRWRPSKTEICSQLDRHFADLQDSSALLLQPEEKLEKLPQLQRRRTAGTLQQLLDDNAFAAFRPTHLRSPLVNAAGACLGLFLYLAMDSLPAETAGPTSAAAAETTAPQPLAVETASTGIEPPAYTGLAPSTQSLQVRAPEQSRITWRVALNKPADGLTMLAAQRNFAFQPSAPLPSRDWQLVRTVGETDFYQLSVNRGGSETLLPAMHNIDITADRPPEFDFRIPRDNVTVVSTTEDRTLLQVDVQVNDDFAVADTELRITLASGSGENVRFREERVPLQPAGGSAGSLRYRFSVPAQRFEIEPGDELYWFLRARDNRAAGANIADSQHFVLRWPQQEIFGLSDAEGMAIKVLPEYFRSQRQLIIDTEALLEERETLSEADFRERSESLAHEQKLLRLRYGRFLGEEDSATEHAGESPGSGEDRDGHGEEHQEENGHDHHREEHGGEHGGHSHGDSHPGESGGGQQFGDATGVVAAAGHSHDTSEHATLFDPKTKELLRSALNAMWSAWRDLSVIEPRASLPDQHRALRFIKEVQQASRIYLQRVGFETPPLDQSRRLTGERDEVDVPPAQGERAAGEREQLLELLAQVRGGDVPDAEAAQPLQSLGALERDPQLRVELSKTLRLARQRPDCEDCRAQLSALLYQLLPAPTAQPSLPLERAPAGSFADWLQHSTPAEAAHE